MVDIHNHCKYSFDSVENPEKEIQTAINLGGLVFGISDHLNLDEKSSLSLIIDNLIKYESEMKELKKKYKDKIIFVYGLEFNYYEGQDDNYVFIENNTSLDYVINSVHTIKKKSFYHKDYFVNKSRKEAIDEYLDEVTISLHAKFDYQVVGHLGQISKVIPFGSKVLKYSECPNKIDDVLKYIIEHDKVLEINYRFDGINIFPDETIIKRYYELGGRNISLGGDAHVVENVYKYIDTALHLIKKIGFKSICYFENKIRKEINI